MIRVAARGGSDVENERATIVITGAVDVAVVQIASRLVRQIAGYVREGEQVAQGQRIGMIRFGSQVDLVLPDVPGLRVTVRPGERVEGATSVLARLATAAPPSQSTIR